MEAPKISLRKEYPNSQSYTITILIGAILTALLAIIFLVFNFKLIQKALVISIFIELFSIISYSLLQTRTIKEIRSTTIKTVEKPIVKEVQVPVETKPIIIERPVIQKIIQEVERPVYIQKESKKLDIPKYEYVGSSETKTFHKHSCRLSKLIKKKYKISNNSDKFFKSHGFKACKVCIKKKK